MAQQNPFLASTLETVTDRIQQERFELPPLPQEEAAAPAVQQVAAPKQAKAAKQSSGDDDYAPPPDLRPLFESAARKYNVPVNVLMALGHQESRFNPTAIGVPTQWGRAKGMMQYLDDTASRLGINPFDPEQAVSAAAKQIRQRLDKGYTMEEAVKAHFAGDDRKLWKDKTAAYGREVLQKASRIGEALYPFDQSPEEVARRDRQRTEIQAQEVERQRMQQPAATGLPQQQPRERTWGEVASDTGVQLAEGVNNIFGAVPNLVSPEGEVAAFFNRNAEYWSGQQSEPLKQKIEAANAKISEAGKDGILAQMTEAASTYFTDPGLAARFITTNLPSMIPGVAAAKVAQAAAVARGATAAKAAAAATTAAGGANAVLNAGGARGEAFNDIKQILMRQGMTEEQATEQALKDSRVVAAVGSATGYLSGKTGLESALVGKQGANSAVRAGLGAGVSELAGEQAEEVLPKVTTNYQAGQYDKRSLGQDVGRTIVETAIGSGPGAAISGGVAAMNARGQQTGTKPAAGQGQQPEFDMPPEGSAFADTGAQSNPLEQRAPTVEGEWIPAGDYLPTWVAEEQQNSPAGPMTAALENAAAQQQPQNRVQGAGPLARALENAAAAMPQQPAQPDAMPTQAGDQPGALPAPQPEQAAPPYADRYKSRIDAIKQAKTQDEVKAILGDEYGDDERHMEGTGLVEREARKRTREFEQAAVKQAELDALERGEWVPADYGSMARSKAEREADRLNQLGDGFEYDAHPDNYDGYAVMKRKAAKQVDQPAKLEDMTEDELRARLKHLAGQAKSTGGWNKMLMDERRKIERQIDKLTANKDAANGDTGIRDVGQQGNQAAAQAGANQQGAGAGDQAGDAGMRGDAGAFEPGARAGVLGADATADAQPALKQQKGTAADIAGALGQMARREHPATVDPRVDRILAAETYLQNIAANDSEHAAQIAADFRATPEKFAEVAGVPPEIVGRYASIIERRLGTYGKQPAAKPATATADPGGQEFTLQGKTEPQLRAMLKDIATQAKTEGWTPKLKDQRRAVERTINQLVTDDFTAAIDPAPADLNELEAKVYADLTAAMNAQFGEDVAAELIERAAVMTDGQSAEQFFLALEGLTNDRQQQTAESTPAGQEPTASQPAEGSAGAAQQSQEGQAEEVAPAKDEYAGKWFGSEEKAQAFIDKKKAGATHEAVQTGKVRWEIKPKQADAKPELKDGAKVGVSFTSPDRVETATVIGQPYNDQIRGEAVQVALERGGSVIVSANRITAAPNKQQAAKPAQLDDINVADSATVKESLTAEAAKDVPNPAPAAQQPAPAVEEVQAEDRQPDAFEAAKYLKDFVYSLGSLEGMTDRAQVALSSDLGKSGRDTLLMQAFGITRGQAHDINNSLDSRKPNKLRNEDMQEAFDLFPGLRKIVDDAVKQSAWREDKQQDAPGTRVNGDAERAAADRLEKLYDQMSAITNRNSLEGNAKAVIRSMIEELRRPKTVTNVVGVLEKASSDLMRKYGAFAQVVQDVADSLDGKQNAPRVSLNGKATGDVLNAEDGTQYLIEGIDIKKGKIRLTRNPNMLSERVALVDQDRFDRLVAEDEAVRAEAMKGANLPAARSAAKAAEVVDAPVENPDELIKAIADAVRGDAQVRFVKDKDTGRFNLSIKGLFIGTMDKQPAKAEEALAVAARRYMDALAAAGRTMPQDPRQMTRDQFVAVNGLAGLVQDFEVTGPIDAEGSGVKVGDNGLFYTDHDALYDRIQAEAKPTEPATPTGGKKGQFANNKIFTADKVEAARARLKSKLNQLNSGIDPELLVDGMTIAGAYIEDGVRNFRDYAKAMTEDFGDGIKPYLLSFYEAARNYPGLNTEGMTPVGAAKVMHSELMKDADTSEAKEAIGETVEKPAKRTKKTGAKSDMTLTQDWGVDHIDGWEELKGGANEPTYYGLRGGVKDAFLKEARAYLNTVAGILTEQGYAPHTDSKGRPEKPVSVNESGVATSGDVSLTLVNPETGSGIYVHIGDTSLRGVVPTTPSGIAIMFRSASADNKFGTGMGSTNRWAPVDLSAADFAAELDKEAKRAAEVASRRNSAVAQGNAAPTITEEVKQNDRNANQAAPAGGAGNRALEGVPAGQVRGTEGSGDAEQRGAEGGRNDAGRAGQTDRAGLSARGGMGSGARDVSVPAGRSGGKRGGAGQSGLQAATAAEQDNAGAVAEQRSAETAEASKAQAAGDYRITDLTKLGEGGQKTKYRNNVAAIRLLNELQRTGRPATAEEQDTLARYVGWGGIAQAFDSANADWAKEYAELKELLTPEEWDSANESTQYAHYTSQEIITSMYDALKRMGFTGGKMMEPGSGVGNFMGLMPDDLRSASRFTAVERERIAGGIAKLLYPNQNVQQQDFRKFHAQDGYFDVAIGNPPFASQPLTDLTGRKHLSGLSVHNYFFAKSVDMLREGGILAMVVSNSFLDAKRDKARQYIGERTELLGAIRLPNNAFAKNANTQVTTDIIFLRKRPESEWGSKAAREDMKRWMNISSVPDPLGGELIPLNQYFIDNPQMMLGRMERSGTMYRAGQTALVAREGQDTAALLKQAINRLPENVFTPAVVKNTEAMQDAEITALADDAAVDVGGHYVKDGSLFVRLGDVAGEGRAMKITATTKISEKRELGKNGLERLKQLADMRVTVRQLLAAEIADAKNMEELRTKLNEQYDRYVKEFGYINQRTTVQLFGDDPDFPLLASLEHGFDPGIGAAAAKSQGVKAVPASAKKAPIFSRRVIEKHEEVTKADTPEDALMVSIAERGQIDPAYIGSLLGRDGAAVLDELTKGDKPALFIDPATGGYVLRDAYLSGNVRKKLEQAKANGMYGNVAELEKVIPEDIPAHEISGKIGAPWVPTSVYEEFASEIMGEGTKARVVYVQAVSSYIADFKPGSEVANTNTFGTTRMGAADIFAALLNSKEIKVGYYEEDPATGSRRFVLEKDATDEANDKAREIKDKFNDWLFADAERAEKMQRAYNDAVNNYVTRVFDGSMLKFPGKVPDAIIKLRRHQRNAVARIIQDGTALLDHVVGAGKTFTVIAAAMELKRTGLAKKPMIVVPNHLVKQWAADFYRLYPGANILTATKKDFEKANRRKFLAKIATGNWDAVIMAHSSFGFIKPDAEFELRFNQERIDEIIGAIDQLEKEGGQESKRTVKQLAKMKEGLENKLAALRDKPMDDLLDFGQIGVDHVFVDEAHLFKNLMFVTKMQNVRGLGQPKGSQRAYDMFIKTHQIYQQNGNGRGVVFATGTPVSNSLAEMYHMLRYLAPQTLLDSGQFTFDAWAKTYADVEQVWMQSMSGDGYKASNRMGRFVNTPELLRVFDQVADTVTIDDIKQAYAEENNGAEFPIPKLKNGRRTPVSIPRSQAQTDYMAEVADRAKQLEQRKGKPQKGEDNMLSIMGDARKAAMDIRMVRPDIKERDQNGRIAIAARNIMERYQRYNDVRGTQLVFSDMGTPKKQAEKELKEYNELMAAAAPLSDEQVLAMAELGDEAAQEALEKAEEAQRKIDAKGQDWMDAIQAAMRGFSVYDDLKDALVEMGIPENEIAFIHDYNTDDQKAALFRAVNDGKVRVLLGSTEKMGAGTNVQERAVALHHLDVPWKPSDIEQREGRVIRQGNKLLDLIPGFDVEVMAYATQDTLDLFMWQTQEKKLSMIAQLRTGNVGREVDNAFEEMQMSAGEMQAAATSNPYLLEEIQLKDKVKRLERQKRSFDGQRNDLLNRRKRAERDIEQLPSQIKAAEKIEATAVKALAGIDEHFAGLQATVNGQTVTGAANIRNAVRDAVNNSPAEDKDGKEVRKISIEFNGKEYTSQSGLADAVNKELGDAAQIAYTLPDGKTVYRAAEVAAELVDPVANMMEAETDQTELGKVGDFEVTAYRIGADSIEVSISLNGDEVSSYEARFDLKELSTLTNTLRAIPNRIQQALVSMRGNAAYLRSKLERAKKNLADIASKPAAGEWEGEAELKKAREDYRAVIKKLAETGSSQDQDIDEAIEPEDVDGVAEQQLGGTVPNQLRNADGTYRRQDPIRYSVNAKGKAGGDVARVMEELRNGPYGEVIARLIDAGQIVLHQSADTLPGAARGKRGVQAVTLANGEIHLVADSLEAGSAMPVLLHEMFHKGGQALVGSKAWGNLMGRLGSLKRQASSSAGKMNEFFQRANDRVEAARQQGAVSTGMTAEEFGAYAIEEWEQKRDSLPAVIRKWVEDLIGTIKAYMMQRYGKQLGDVTPAQLAAMAKMVIMNAAVMDERGQPSGATGKFSVAPEQPNSPRAKRNRESVEKNQDAYGDAKAAQGAEFSRFSGIVDQAGRNVVKGINALRTTWGLVSDNQKAIPAIRDAYDLEGKMDGRRIGIATEASKAFGRDFSEMAIKDPATADKLADLMTQATLWQIKPDKPKNDRWRREWQEKYDELRAMWDALPQEAKDLYDATQQFYEARSKDIHNALKERIMALEIGEKQKRDMLAELQERFDRELGTGPYFPLARFGSYLVIGVKGEGDNAQRVVMNAEYAPEAEAMAAELRRRGYEVNTKMAKDQAQDQDMRQSSELVRKIAEMIEMQVPDFIAAPMLDELNQIFLDALPLASARKSFIHRKNVAGFSRDMARALNQSAVKLAGQIAKLEYAQKIEDAFVKADKQAEAAPDNFDLQPVVAEMRKRFESTMRFKTNPVAAALQQAGFAFTLAYNLSSAAVNLLQMTIAGGHMGARHGAVKANAQIAKALGEIATTAKQRDKNAHIFDLRKPGSPLNDGEKKMLEALEKSGKIDVTAAMDAYRAAHEDTKRIASSKFGRVMQKVLDGMGVFMQAAEVVNRQAVALAAYRMELQKTDGDVDAAIQYAAEVLDDTQFNMNISNQPRFMHNNAVRVVMQYKGFAINMMDYLGRTMRTAMDGMDKGERRQATKALGMIFAAQVALAGIGSLPLYIGAAAVGAKAGGAAAGAAGGGMGAARLAKVLGGGVGALALAAFLNGAFGDDDEPWDWKADMRRWLAENTNATLAQLLDRGLFSIAGVDIADRISMNGLMMRDLQEQHGKKAWQNMAEEAALGMGGVAMSKFYLGGARALDALEQGNTKDAFVSMLPLALANVLKGADMAANGVTDKRTGAKLMDVNAGEAMVQIFGFQPSDVRERRWADNVAYNADKQMQDRKSRLLEGIAKAVMADDSKAEDAAWEAADRWNEKNGDLYNPITQRDVNNRVRQLEDQRSMMEGDGRTKGQRQQLERQSVYKRGLGGQ